MTGSSPASGERSWLRRARAWANDREAYASAHAAAVAAAPETRRVRALLRAGEHLERLASADPASGEVAIILAARCYQAAPGLDPTDRAAPGLDPTGRAAAPGPASTDEPAPAPPPEGPDALAGQADLGEVAARARAQLPGLRELARGSLRRLEAPRLELDRMRVHRTLRLSALLAALLLPIALVALALRPTDLARGRPIKTSSSYCDPAATPGHLCRGRHTMLIFHTNNEDNPWAEIDLGATRSISSVYLKNRRDCCADRATPLVVQVKGEAGEFRTVATRERPFQRWTASFAPQQARYVRVMTHKKTTLHLEEIKVY